MSPVVDPLASASFWLVLEPPIQIPLLFLVLGNFSRHAAAFRTLAVVICLFQCAHTPVQVAYVRVERSN